MLNNKVKIYLSGKNSRDIDFIIETNLTKEEVCKAYNDGVKIVGFNFIHDYCTDETTIDHNCAKKLVELGLQDFKLSKNKKDCENGYWLNAEDFLNIYLFICKLGNSEFIYEKVDDKSLPSIDIGGYGIVER